MSARCGHGNLAASEWWAQEREQAESERREQAQRERGEIEQAVRALGSV